jgi:hypothetical protein
MANEIRDAFRLALRYYERRDRSSGNARIRGRVAAQAEAAQALADQLANTARRDERQVVAAELVTRAAAVLASGRPGAAAIAAELEAAAQNIAAAGPPATPGGGPGTVPGRSADRG